MTLKDVKEGQSVRIFAVGAGEGLRQHLLDMGLIPGRVVTVKKFAPLGDPVEVLVQSYSLSLRLSEAAKIEVVPEDAVPDSAEEDMGYNLSLHEHNSHPGYGESGKYHSKDHANPLPKGTLLTFALAGQQNCGKTTLFNALTGSKQHVGNFPGVTVDRKDGALLTVADTRVTDLPGIYSLSTYTAEEVVSRDFLINERPRCIINVVDSTNIERNLYLTLQLMELGIPVVLALNMIDEFRGNGGHIRLNEMERLLGIPVVPISAARNEGIQELVDHAVHLATFQELPARQDFCPKDDPYSGAVHRCLHSIMHLIEGHAAAASLPLRFAASRLVCGDKLVEEKLALEDKEKELIENIVTRMEEERGLDRVAAMSDMRYSFIRDLCRRTVVRPRESKEYRRTVRIDKVLTGRWTAIPFFVAVMGLVLWLSIDVIGSPLQELLGRLIDAAGTRLGVWMDSIGLNPVIRSLVVDAIFGGVGTVVSFVPIIIVLFFFLSLLEDSGYMARIAFVTDKLLRKLGLSGRSIVPMLIGLGCSVPAVMATRTLPSASDRKKTILLIPFMSCSAKIPVYAFFASAFFPGHGGLVLICMYLLGLVLGVLDALVAKWLGKNAEAAPFVMELPNYRLPHLKNLGHLIWDKTKDFLQRAFTVIFVAMIVIWFLQTFDWHFNMVADSKDSILASIADLLVPLFEPIGLGDWRIVVSLISGFLAKETVVSTMEVLGVTGIMNVLTAIPMLVFCLLYTPCVSAIAVIRAELGSGWAAFVAVFQCVLAWVCALAAYLLAGLFIG